MDLLLDTNVFIWFINGDKNLSKQSKSLIQDLNNKCFLSIASLWEIAIKVSLGKLQIASEFEKMSDFMAENEIELLPITFENLQALLKLPKHHTDPFDRIIIAQAITGNFTVLSAHQKFQAYQIDLIQ
ncbi:MAG TPA: type II toxin-antitoxin system VapC family toxin [Flavipsychrobacter sp.]|nr:type II toxin-antitoxin system VapC family toxin [Flavipsychrobacter sp.]